MPPIELLLRYKICLEPQSDVTISLDAAQVAFIDFDKLVLSLKGGELYVLTLCADSMRSVRSFHFSKAASSVLTSCVSYFLIFLCREFFFSSDLSVWDDRAELDLETQIR